MAGTVLPFSSNFNGTLDEYLYLILQNGADFLDSNKGCAYQKIGVRYKTELDKLSYTVNPLENYTAGNPTFASGSAGTKRVLETRKMTISGKFSADEWLNQWDKYAPNGSLTDLMVNQSFLQRVLELALNSTYTQLANLFWVGDINAGGGSPLRFFDGVITKLKANSDADVIFPLPAGVITQANIVDRIVDVYKLIPDKYFEDPLYKLHVSFADFRLLQLYNNDAKKTSVGVLNEIVLDLFLNKKIVPFLGFPKDHILACKSGLGEDSNLVFGSYFSIDSEFQGIQVAKIENLGKEYGFRVDFMADTQYRSGSDIVLYKPV